MDSRRGHKSVKTVAGHCKPGPGAGLLLAAAVLFPGCAVAPRTQVITLEALLSAPALPVPDTRRVVAGDTETLRNLCTPLGPRLGLLQIHNRGEWERLAAIAPQLGRCPDLHAGTQIGLACWAGTPLEGQWPVMLDSVRVYEGGGLVAASFNGGSYLPDGSARLETGYVKGLRSVLVVNVNGASFYPEP